MWKFREFIRIFHCFFLNDSANHTLGGSYFVGSHHSKLPASVDWRHHGAITHVKDQRDCGGCWAFATTGAVEAHNFLKSGHLVSLSEQNLVDCSRPFGNNGCHGGYPNLAFKYIKVSGGIDTEAVYPYAGIDEECRPHHQRHRHGMSGMTVEGFVQIPADSELKLQEAIATAGPIAVCIDASQYSFQLYKSGIYSEPLCQTHTPDHAVLVVGYGTDEFQQDYYIIKNSWGKSWGEHGYMRIARNHGNHCGIAFLASYPIV